MSSLERNLGGCWSIKICGFFIEKWARVRVRMWLVVLDLLVFLR